ncbi:MAG: ATP-binding protein [Nodosilinea sp.]
MSYQKTSCIQIPSDPTALGSLLTWFNQFQDSPIPYRLWLQCQLALAEGFTNAVRHAHAHLPATTLIAIEIVVSDRTIDMRIWDQGPGFDFSKVLANQDCHCDRSAEKGRGLIILSRVADQLSYHTYSGKGNCLHLHKAYGDS